VLFRLVSAARSRDPHASCATCFCRVASHCTRGPSFPTPSNQPVHWSKSWTPHTTNIYGLTFESTELIDPPKPAHRPGSSLGCPLPRKQPVAICKLGVLAQKTVAEAAQDILFCAMTWYAVVNMRSLSISMKDVPWSVNRFRSLWK